MTLIFDYIYGLTVVQKGLKICPSDCIQMSKSLSFRGLRPLDQGVAPGPHQGPYGAGGPWTPRRFMLRSLCSNYY